MKKQILLLVMMQSVALSVFAEEVEINGLWYNLSGTTAEVIPYKNEVKYSGDIVIPSTVSYNNIDYGVTIIGSYAFRFCSDLTSITIPNSVTTIDYGAFEDCSNLISVTIPNSVTSIGLSFAGCSSLTAIIVDDNNASYASEGGVLFDKDKTILLQYPPAKIESAYVIPNSVTTISDYAFSHCGGLTSITIPNGVKRINSGTFCDCSRLTSITIPDGVTSIGWGAFADCSGLTSITIPNSVTSIGPVAFENCI